MSQNDGTIGGSADVAGEERAPVPPQPVEPPKQEVRRRHVLYVPGYDPREPALYHRLAALELRRFAKLWGAKVHINRGVVADPDTPSLRWTARISAGDAKVEVSYETLRWDDIVAKDFAAPLAIKVLRGFGTLGDALFSGLLWRVARASPWCAIAWLYPVLMTFGTIALGAAFGAVVWLIAAHFDLPTLGAAAGVAAALATTFAALETLRRSGSFVLHLMDDGYSQRLYARRLDPDMERRVDAFAARIRAVKADPDIDEILIVGHSSGAFLAIDALARAYEADPLFGPGRPATSLLTVGATELMVALHPAAGWFRERLRRIAVERTVFWAEVVAPWDTLNFPRRDPVTELKLDAPADRPNPTFRRAFLTKMLKPQSIRKLQRERNVFRVHFQFIMANEVRGPFDYFSLVCGPWRARTQFRRTAKGAYMSPYLGAPAYPQSKDETPSV